MSTSVLSTITQGTPNSEGKRIVIAGVEGIGKTTLACGAPGALLIPLEVGFGGMTVQKTAMIQDFATVNSFLDESIYYCQRGQFPFKSLVFDSATALERQIHTDVLMADPNYEAKKNSKAVTMETVLGGYGKGHTFANEKFDMFLKKCDYLATAFGINIILTCHVFAAKLVDPASGEYDSWDLLLHSPKNNKNYGKREMITQWADIIGFLYEPMFVTKGDGVAKGVSAQKGRMLGLTRTPAYVAKNRYHVAGEITIPPSQGWNYLADALYKASGVNIFNLELK